MDHTTPSGVDTSQPNAARMYDYYLGGQDNFEADRNAAEPILKMVPELPEVLKGNRTFNAAAVHHLAADHGIRQFLDIGTGLPTPPNVHETAQAVHPGARVVYVDNDPTVVLQNSLLLNDDNVVTIEGDARRPGEILNDPQLRSLLDFDEPIALLLVAIFHFITDEEDPRAIIEALTTPLPAGSYLAISAAISDQADPDTLRRVSDIYVKANAPFVWRSRNQVATFFGDWPLIAPGLVAPVDWRPDGSSADKRVDDRTVDWFCAGVARKPS